MASAEQTVGGGVDVGILWSPQTEFYSVVVLLVVLNVPLSYFVVGRVHRVPGIVSSLFHVGSTFGHRVTAWSVETCLVDNIDRSLRGVAQGESFVIGHHFAIGFRYTQNGAKVYALLSIARSMTRHDELASLSFHFMWYLSAQCQLAVNGFRLAGLETYGNKFVGMRSNVLAGVGDAVSYKAVSDVGAVQAELTPVLLDAALVPVVHVECGQRLVGLTEMSLQVVLQRVGQAVVFTKQGFTYLRNPY